MAGADPDTSAAHEPSRPVGDAAAPGDVVPFRDAVKAWFTISLQTFGGPAGQIAVMQRHLVDERRWIGQKRFLHALDYCMLLPGPEAQQLAIYVGWLLNGLRGGLVAGILFVLPGVVALLTLSPVYVGFGDTTVVTALFAGLAPAGGDGPSWRRPCGAASGGALRLAVRRRHGPWSRPSRDHPRPADHGGAIRRL